MDKTGTRSYEPNLKHQSNEWKRPCSPCSKKVRSTQCAAKVMFIVANNIAWVILHHAISKADGKCCLLLHFLQHHLRPVLRRKRRHLEVQNPIILLTVQGVTALLLSRTSCVTGNGRFCYIHRTDPIWVYVVIMVYNAFQTSDRSW